MLCPKRVVQGRAYRHGMTTGIPVLAGIASTIVFAASVLPMVVKAWQTRDLRSYSRGNLVLANIGNGVHSVYVFALPRGPIWVLHSFYVVTSALMLLWSVRYGSAYTRPAPDEKRARPKSDHRSGGEGRAPGETRAPPVSSAP
jgi:hypothetical protein